MRADEDRRAIAADINNIHEMMRTDMLALLQIHLKLHIQDLIIRAIKASSVTFAISRNSYFARSKQ
jgi:hypothetical protein